LRGRRSRCEKKKRFEISKHLRPLNFWAVRDPDRERWEKKGKIVPQKRLAEKGSATQGGTEPILYDL